MLSLAFCFKDLQGADSKEASKRGGVRLSGFKKELVALTKQVSDLFDQIERTNRIVFKRKRPWIWPSVFTISGRLTIASGYTQQIISRGTQEEEKLKKIKLPIFKSSQNVWNLWNTDAWWRELFSHGFQMSISKILTQQLFQYYDIAWGGLPRGVEKSTSIMLRIRSFGSASCKICSAMSSSMEGAFDLDLGRRHTWVELQY